MGSIAPVTVQLAFSGFVLATIEFGRELRLKRARNPR
jgi:hypothetical protein